MYRLTLTDNQFKAVTIALEEYFRLRMGQTWDLADDLAAIGVDLSKDNPHQAAAFDSWLDRRESTRLAADAMFRIATCDRRNALNVHNVFGEIGGICEDIWQVMRHQSWLDNPNRSEWSVDRGEPLPVSDEPLAKVERCEG